MGDVRYSAVIPVYGNEGSLPALLSALAGVFGRLDGLAEAVFVIDASPDQSLQVLEAAAVRFPHALQVVEHARNFGAFAAIRTGLRAARGQYVGIIAADLQEPPDLLATFFARLAADEADIVIGRRESRSDGPSGVASRIYWSLYRRIVLPELPTGGVDVFGLNRAALEELLSMDEASSSLIGQLYWIGFRRIEVGYERQPRLDGRSAWTLKKKLRYLSDSVYSFTSIPIQMLTALGAIGIVTTLGFSAVVLVSWLTGRIPEPGYTPLMLVLLGCTFLLVFSLGVVGNYVWRTYENSKQRPLAIVSRRRMLTRGRDQ